MPKLLMLSLLFACIGITTEVVFTAVSKVIQKYIHVGVMDWALEGKTYLWMFLIYASIPLLFHLFHGFVKQYSIWIRALFTVGVIYIVEFTTGFFLEITTGVCPWKYETGWHFFGYIRFDYFPFWFLFALLIISVFNMLHRRIS